MLLDRVLSELDVGVEAFSLCIVSPGWRLRLPGPPEAMVHYVLEGRGAVLGPEGWPSNIAPGWLAIVPRGARHALEAAGRVEHELHVPEPPPRGVVPRVVAGSSDRAGLRVACGLFHARHGGTLGLFDHLREVLRVNLSESREARSAISSILTELAHPGPGASALTSALMSQCLVIVLRHLARTRNGTLPWLFPSVQETLWALTRGVPCGGRPRAGGGLVVKARTSGRGQGRGRRERGRVGEAVSRQWLHSSSSRVHHRKEASHHGSESIGRP